ncbi:Hypothetical protein LUCI_0822 [Lucifera butyrica]|uniref:HTH cro/C1-type domain-containing protein n=1 Tax=Lucifera butyrica TaxID=1351585 RepID=A0A498R5U7_9FIRM|nr:helix-turn-helix transcriptional regulator [Lucifera butyrica]VBB05612.1 Hypothetical protein LUCI_0822 [Lucifera butyrica]
MGLSGIVLKTIKKLRIDNKYSLNDVAKGIGYETAKGYYDLESGKTDIKLEHLEKLSKFYKVPLEIFLNPNSTITVHGEEPTNIQKATNGPDPKPAA